MLPKVLFYILTNITLNFDITCSYKQTYTDVYSMKLQLVKNSYVALGRLFNL